MQHYGITAVFSNRFAFFRWLDNSMHENERIHPMFPIKEKHRRTKKRISSWITVVACMRTHFAGTFISLNQRCFSEESSPTVLRSSLFQLPRPLFLRCHFFIREYPETTARYSLNAWPFFEEDEWTAAPSRTQRKLA